MYGLKELRLGALICSLSTINLMTVPELPCLCSSVFYNDCLILFNKLRSVKGDLGVASSLVNYFSLTISCLCTRNKIP